MVVIHNCRNFLKFFDKLSRKKRFEKILKGGGGDDDDDDDDDDDRAIFVWGIQNKCRWFRFKKGEKVIVAQLVQY
ncbi:hypothetical protein BLOT_001419 [Blomia tropicalis]|nr:hypothetical protein BLOT_001419 [Blomia tropicalis]